MRKRADFARIITIVALALSVEASTTITHAGQLRTPQSRTTRQIESLKEEVRHQLVMMPYYSVFDWLEAQVKADGTVTLNGQVTRPTIKDDAASRVKGLEAATKVINNIEVLPVSTMDDQLRSAVYRAIYRYDSPLFKYALQSVGPIHIIVKNGHLTLKGIVASQADKQLAFMSANGVSGVFDVQNDLQIEERKPAQ